MSAIEQQIDLYCWNLVVHIYEYGIPQIEDEDQRRKVKAAFMDQDMSQFEFIGRDGKDLVFRVAGTTFHVPIVALTRPVDPNTPALN